MNRHGERVRAACGATGRYLDWNLALIVSAQDNDLMIDSVADPASPNYEPPHPTLPVPTDGELRGAVEALRYARTTWKRGVHTDE